MSKLSAVASRPAKGAVIPGVDDPEGSRLPTMLFGPFSGELAQIGVYLRDIAGLGAEQLRSVSDEQIGAIAVALWRSQNFDNVIGRRVRKTFWNKPGAGK